MIYLVGKNDITIPGVEKISVENSINMISSWPVVQFDTETTGLDPHINKLISLQFGYKDFKTGNDYQIVVDCSEIQPEVYKTIIERSMLIGHNIKFDLEFLYNHRIVPLNLYDTMICEQLLYLGYQPGQVSMNLASVLLRYTGQKLDKSFQSKIANKGLTEKGIVYAANDVKYLQDIRKSQIAIAKDRNCINAFTVENRVVPAIAYLEWCGVHLDEKKWSEKMKDDKAQLDEALNKLNEYVISHTALKNDFVSTCTEPSMFEPELANTEFCTVDWDSSKQVVPVAKKLGFDTTVMDKKTKKERYSVDEKTLSNQKGIDDKFLELYFDYKGCSKIVTSYGQGHLNLINPNTGRLHTEFKQFGTVTGRMSSGGGDGENSKGKTNADLAKIKGLPAKAVRFVNLQNLPARGDAGAVTRSCFTSTPGNVFISCDYSAEESRVSADVWNEKKLLDCFEHGIDTHNLYAKMCFPKELKDVDVKDVKKVRPDLRQNAKYFEFELSYGGNGSETAKKLGIDRETAMKNVANVQKEMPGMMAYKKKLTKFLKEHGYIIINPITGHRIYWPEWASWKATEDKLDRNFWDNYRMYHKGTEDSTAQMVRKHMSQAKDWFNKNVLNYPIQGGSAIVLKQAAADLFKWIVEHGYFGKILFCVFVHDEIDAECPEELADMFSKVIVNTMEKAAGKYYHKLKIPADCSVGSYWIH